MQYQYVSIYKIVMCHRKSKNQSEKVKFKESNFKLDIISKIIIAFLSQFKF